MNKITNTLLAIALAASAGWAADPPETPKKSDAEVLYEKLLAENTKEADKAYGAYLVALNKANEAILKKLEAAKADFNDMKKFPKLGIQERAAAIAEINAKIQEVKKSGVGDAIVAARNGDLLGEGEKTMSLSDIKNKLIGKWNRSDNLVFVIDKGCSSGSVGNKTTTYGKYNIVIDKSKTGSYVVKFVGSAWFMEIVSIDADTIEVINEVGSSMKLSK